MTSAAGHTWAKVREIRHEDDDSDGTHYHISYSPVWAHSFCRSARKKAAEPPPPPDSFGGALLGCMIIVGCIGAWLAIKIAMFIWHKAQITG